MIDTVVLAALSHQEMKFIVRKSSSFLRITFSSRLEVLLKINHTARAKT